MEIIVSRTRKGTKLFPMHKHAYSELSFYSETAGVMKTPDKSYPFSPGSIVIIPPDTYHSTIGETELDGIYLRGDFNALPRLKSPLVLRDNRDGEGKKLINIIYNNRFGNREYLASLCDAYIHFLITNMQFDDEIGEAVKEIKDEITRLAYDSRINPTEILKKSGYAEDYIRAKFKEATGKTPIAFLTDIRIKHARFLTETFGSSLTLAEVAEMCGYTDYVYFSKKFKEVTGLSPRKYRMLNSY